MKYVFIASLILFFVGCKDDSTGPEQFRPALITDISGNVSNWTFGDGYNVEFCYFDESIARFNTLASAPISTNGSFSINIGNIVPPLSLKISEIEYFALNSTVNISNPEAMGNIAGFFLCKNGSKIGILTNDGNFHDSIRIGDYTIRYIYANEDVDVTGHTSKSFSTRNDRYEVTHDNHYRKGWNSLITMYADCQPNIDSDIIIK